LTNGIKDIIPQHNKDINITSAIINVYKKYKETAKLGNVEHIRIHHYAMTILKGLFEKYQDKMDQVYQMAAIKQAPDNVDPKYEFVKATCTKQPAKLEVSVATQSKNKPAPKPRKLVAKPVAEPEVAAVITTEVVAVADAAVVAVKPVKAPKAKKIVANVAAIAGVV
jgi:GDP-D-mannose dehydratase